MDWVAPLIFILGGFIFLTLIGTPVGFAFLFINVIGTYVYWGGTSGWEQLILSIYTYLTRFSFLPVVMFTLMGEVMFLSGMAPRMIDALGKMVGRVPGRLSLLTVMGATVFATMSGSAMAATATLGEVLVPEMEKRGYKKPMTLGPILGCAGLAIMIPPTGLGIVLASLAEVSIGKLLIAIVIPGFLLAGLYFMYIVIRCLLQPHLAPVYELERASLSEKILSMIKYVLPLGSITFAVLGLIFLGIATPTQSATFGTIASIILAAFYKKLNWSMFNKAVSGTTRLAGTILMIIAGAGAFSQILTFSGASKGVILSALSLPLPPIAIIVLTQIIVLILGCFMGTISIMMITLPIFMPLVYQLGFDPMWFVIIMMLNIEMAGTTPPFGLTLFVMKGVTKEDVLMTDIYKAGLPFLGCDLVLMVLMFVFPQIVLWLPGIVL